MSFIVRFSPQAVEDLDRLLDFLLDRAETAADLDHAQQAVDATRLAAATTLSLSPFSCRKSGASPTRRELIIPFGATGYVALYEIEGPGSVVVLAVRLQREEDYH